MAHLCKNVLQRHYNILYIGTTTSRSFALSSCLLFVSLIQSVNGAVNAICGCYVAVAPTAIIVMISLTGMPNCNHINLTLALTF